MVRRSGRLPAVALAAALSQTATAGERIDRVTVRGDADCTRIDIHLNAPFTVVARWPGRPGRVFHLFGRPLRQAGAERLRAERAPPIPGRPYWLDSIRYTEGVPGLDILSLETRLPRGFLRLPQHDPRVVGVLVRTPGHEADCQPGRFVGERD